MSYCCITNWTDELGKNKKKTTIWTCGGSTRTLEITDPSVLIAIRYFGTIVVSVFTLMKSHWGIGWLFNCPGGGGRGGGRGKKKKPWVFFFPRWQPFVSAEVHVYTNVRSCIWLGNNNNNDNNNQRKNTGSEGGKKKMGKKNRMKINKGFFSEPPRRHCDENKSRWESYCLLPGIYLFADRPHLSDIIRSVKRVVISTTNNHQESERSRIRICAKFNDNNAVYRYVARVKNRTAKYYRIQYDSDQMTTE